MKLTILRRSPGRTAIPVALAALCALAAHASAREAGATERTRIVLVTVDTLRYDAFAPDASGPDASDRSATPTMPATRAFAARGLSFERFYATTPITQPTHASLFTGLHPWTHGVHRNGLVLADEQLTLAEHLRANGFETHAVVASFALHEDFGFAQGFDTYDDDFDRVYTSEWGGRRTDDGRFFSLAGTVTRKAIDAIDRATGDRQFFWVHYFDPHDPYGDTGLRVVPMRALAGAIGKPTFDAKLEDARRAYARDVRSMDAALSALFRRLDEDADHVRTHVVLTADHGESFGELRSIGHGKRVSPEQVHVPLVVVSPAVEPGVRADVASSVDVARTVLSLAGVPPGPFGGRDLASGGTDGEGAVGMRTTFDDSREELLTDGAKRSLRGPWFFTVIDGRIVSGDATRTLDEDDPARPVSGDRADAPRELFRALSALLERGGTADENLDPKAREALRALGYVR